MGLQLGDVFLHYFRGRRQVKVLAWAVAAFGEVAKDPKERAKRFIEEAIELTQAMGVYEDEVLRIVRYVYDRPVGETFQEVGGVSLTLLALCESIGMAADDAEWWELNRVLKLKIDALRAKQNAKAKAGVGGEVV
jgi:hypothetical protein